ncbi:MAG: hypothetical protein JSU64_06510 [candidate division WOR-3 bacterium]|nr:MAG: hypothetical protein JSU64_06510 [candidate division WOR-3 bacterium]UCF04964.1 MAG: hypothetical protein JSV33_13735 [bacterium]
MRSVILVCIGLLFVQPVALQAQDWNFHIVDDAGTAGYQSQVTVTSDGTPYILYKDASTNDLYLASWVSTGGNGGGWDKLLIDTYSNFLYAIEIIADSDDYLHLAWDSYSPQSVNYAVYDPQTETWIVPEEQAAAEYGSLDLAIVEHALNFTAYIVYVHRYSPYHLKLCTRDPDTGIWSVETIHDQSCSGTMPSIAADLQGDLHISFREAGSSSLMYATNANVTSTWVTEYVDVDGNLGQYSSIVIDDSDVPYIVYYDATNADLKYARLVTP